ncbi:MAG: hypothetical protein JNN28_20785 [Saprospiraceae bacterium]|nr:hypothetical protein [Saprospiraceae bacterium]
MKKYLLCVFTCLLGIKTYGQYQVITIETDTSAIELTKNSVYWIWEETLKGKDSVWYSVRYIKDTTQVHQEGWKKKNGRRIGKWSEFTLDGTWLYTIDYTRHSWTYNPKKFKHQQLKDKIKKQADHILIRKFGQEFFDHNLVFNFYGHTYIGKWKTYETGNYWTQEKYLGSWTEPTDLKPNTLVLNYTIVLTEDEYYNDMLQVELDSSGNLIREPSKFDIRLEEIVVPTKSRFTINREKAIQLCKQHPLQPAADAPWETTLRLGWRKMGANPGELWYQVLQQYDQTKEGDCHQHCTITKYYNVWRFNPWTSELLFHKPMKEITRWSQGCGQTGELQELNK